MTVVFATGSGLSPAQAREDALQAAVHRAVGSYVDARTMVTEDDRIREKILAASNAHVKRYKAFGYTTDDGLVYCRLVAHVKSTELKAQIEAIGLDTKKVGGADILTRIEHTLYAIRPTVGCAYLHTQPNMPRSPLQTRQGLSPRMADGVNDYANERDGTPSRAPSGHPRRGGPAAVEARVAASRRGASGYAAQPRWRGRTRSGRR